MQCLGLQASLQEDVTAAAANTSSCTVFPYSATYGRTCVSKLLLAADGGKSMVGYVLETESSSPCLMLLPLLTRLCFCCGQVGQTLRIGGWVKTGREAGAGAWAFLEVNDGSCFDSLQVLLKFCEQCRSWLAVVAVGKRSEHSFPQVLSSLE